MALKCTHQPRHIGRLTLAAKLWLLTQRVHISVGRYRPHSANKTNLSVDFLALSVEHGLNGSSQPTHNHVILAVSSKIQFKKL